MLAAGAAGAWIGTPFLLAEESRTTPAARARVTESTEGETVLTHVFDAVQQLPWPEEFLGRALANAFTRRWHGRESELARDPQAAEEFARARAAQNYSIANIYAGQSVGLVAGQRPARAIVESIVFDAAERIAAAAGLLRQNPDVTQKKPDCARR